MACLKKPVHKRSAVSMRSPDFKCKPGSSFLDDEGCNTCVCGQNGKTAACTQKLCLKKPIHKRSAAVPENTPGFTCTPGEHFKSYDGCNDCVCGNDGKTAGCTFKLCPPTPHSVQKRSVAVPENTPGFTCTPGNHFKSYDGCNDCVCGPDGKTAGCTFKLCPHIPHPHQKRSVAPGHPDFQCEPGSKFKHADGCNSCICAKNGKNALCTLMACSHIHKRDTPDEIIDPNCVPGSIKTIKCNTCRCIEGVGYACTRRACPKKPKIGAPDFQCEPGSTFKDDCNTCTCTDDGKNAFCTAMACLDRKKRDAHEPKIGDPDFRCEPGTTFKDDCNTCTCIEDGKNAFCTDMACPDRKKRDTHVPQIGDADFRCEPGTSFPDTDGCNTCTCMEDGKNAMCTLMDCSNRRKRNTPEHEDANCIPGHTKKIDCNTCTCMKGVGYVCTRLTCPKLSQESDPNFHCEPNTVFPLEDGCNTCTCDSEGKSAVCTLEDCAHKHKRAAEHEDANCVPGSTKKIDCNTCRCAPGLGYVCTKRTCPKLSQATDPNFHCEPNTVFPLKDSCNTCTCDSEGKSAVCTLEHCPDKHKRAAPEHEDPNCVPGSTKTIDCNTCRCAPGLGYVCTKMTCPKYSQLDDPNFNCEPNSIYLHVDGCNTCSCDSEGKSAVCTLDKVCSQKYKRSTPEDSVEKEFNGSPCAPNDKFMIDCNTCYCNSDGSGYSCTQIACSQVNLPLQSN